MPLTKLPQGSLHLSKITLLINIFFAVKVDIKDTKKIEGISVSKSIDSGFKECFGITLGGWNFNKKYSSTEVGVIIAYLRALNFSTYSVC